MCGVAGLQRHIHFETGSLVLLDVESSPHDVIGFHGWLSRNILLGGPLFRPVTAGMALATG